MSIVIIKSCYRKSYNISLIKQYQSQFITRIISVISYSAVTGSIDKAMFRRLRSYFPTTELDNSPPFGPFFYKIIIIITAIKFSIRFYWLH